MITLILVILGNLAISSDFCDAIESADSGESGASG